jgi:hypothetical protein
MIVNINNKDYLFKWNHRIPSEGDNGGTTCFLSQISGNNRKLINVASTSRYYKDELSKEAGRKYSLTKVLDGTFSRSDRAKIWKTYFDRIPQPNPPKV